jgi:hypothetical protein
MILWADWGGALACGARPEHQQGPGNVSGKAFSALVHNGQIKVIQFKTG